MMACSKGYTENLSGKKVDFSFARFCYTSKIIWRKVRRISFSSDLSAFKIEKILLY